MERGREGDVQEGGRRTTKEEEEDLFQAKAVNKVDAEHDPHEVCVAGKIR